MMLSISWKLTLIACITIPLGLIVVSLVAPRSQKYFVAQQKSLGLLNNYVEENYYDKISLKDMADREGVSVYFLWVS